MANELLTSADIMRGKKNFDAQNKYMTGTAEEQVTLPDGQKIKTRAGHEKELKDKFPDSKAGLRDVGNLPGQLPLNSSKGIGLSGMGAKDVLRIPGGVTKLFQLEGNSIYIFSPSDYEAITDAPAPGRAIIHNFSYAESLYRCQQVYCLESSRVFFRNISNEESIPNIVSPWVEYYHSANKKPYTTTTATSANTVVTPTGELQRSTSSAIFKKDIADISIPDYRAALKAVRPVSYRSTDATSDRTDWSWYSFIAEELGALDKRLVQMDSTEFFEDTKEDGTPFINSRELPEGEYAANGININGIVALMVHISQQMLVDIEKLEDEKTQLKRRMTNLEKRLDALEGPAA